VGDSGQLIINNEQLTINNKENIIEITDTKKENDLIVHIANEIPLKIFEERMTKNAGLKVKASVDLRKRQLTMNNHTATHLLNAALKQVLGSHIEQKGSYVSDTHLRFDFAHFSRMTDEEIGKVEAIVNAKIRENISLHVDENIPLEKAMKEMGAVGVFGEKYGDFVRVVTFDKCFSIELCGGTHVPATGQIGLFKILSESAIAAGIRRIEAVTAGKAEGFVNSELKLLEDTREMLKHPKDLLKGLKGIIEENTALKKQIEQYKKEKVNQLKEELMLKAEKLNSISFIAHKVDIDTTSVKDLAFLLNISIENIFLILGNESEDKANITIMISENLVKEKSLNAGVLIRELAKEIDGGGGGQAHFATAGGRNPKGIPAALAKAREIVMKL
jgi:alanyl-tRNA synthetase